MYGKDVKTPTRATKYSAGYDFYAPCDIVLKPGQWVTVDSGVALDGTEKFSIGNGGRGGKMNVPRWFMLLAPRSGLGTKYGIRFANTVGIVDQDYRDNIKFTMTSSVPYTIQKGDRFAQGIFVPCLILDSEDEPENEREGGYGSTGQ